MLHKIYYLPITRSVLGVFVLLVETNLHNIVLVCLFCKISIFHAWNMSRFCNNKAVGNCEAREKAIGISIVFIQDSLRIHYDNLGSYKELLHLIEAKVWRMNELVTLIIHLEEVTEDVIEVLAIDILPSFSNRCHSHV
jgi:hypothetical protein